MQERREKGLCFNCDEKFHLGHECSKPIIFMLEGLEDLEEDEAESNEGKLAIIQPEEPTKKGEKLGELLGISLNAMTGSLSPKTMRIEGFINNQRVLVLVDTGSTHNFMDPIVARRAKLPVGENHLTVKVANGDNIPCTGYCRAGAIQLQNFKTNANLYVLTLGGCDVVLGVDWLRSLGSIAWNFLDLTMKFNFRGSEVQLYGIQLPKATLEEEERAPKLHKGSVKGIWL